MMTYLIRYFHCIEFTVVNAVRLVIGRRIKSFARIGLPVSSTNVHDVTNVRVRYKSSRSVATYTPSRFDFRSGNVRWPERSRGDRKRPGT